MIRSYNGWVASDRPGDIGVVPLVVAGVSFPGGVRSGAAHTVLGYVALQFHQRVEPLVKGWCWGFAFRKNRNADNYSTHASGTGIDCNAPRHPNGKRGTFTAAQVREVRKILAEVDRVVRWGEDFTGTPDGMHFELVGTPAEVAAVAKKLTRPTPKPTQPVDQEDLSIVDADTKKYLDEQFDAVRADTKKHIKTVLESPTHPSLTRLLALLTKVAVKLGVKP